MPLPKYIVRLTVEERDPLEDLICTGKRAASALSGKVVSGKWCPGKWQESGKVVSE
jgi:hypothetical protein